MNENAQKWIDALRSGEYQQSTSRLRTGDTYCCLGVACELHRQARDDKWDASYGEAFTYLEAGAVLPDEVIHWLGLRIPAEFSTHRISWKTKTLQREWTSRRVTQN